MMKALMGLAARFTHMYSVQYSLHHFTRIRSETLSEGYHLMVFQTASPGYVTLTVETIISKHVNGKNMLANTSNVHQAGYLHFRKESKHNLCTRWIR